MKKVQLKEKETTYQEMFQQEIIMMKLLRKIQPMKIMRKLIKLKLKNVKAKSCRKT